MFQRFPVWTRMWALLCVTVAAAGLAVPALAQEKRPMTFLDVIELRRIGAGTISPDGKTVLYTVSIPQWKTGKDYTDIFVAPVDGSGPSRPMTFTAEKNENSPRWAPDGRTFGFLSDREGKTQFYLMRRDGGEARRVSNAKDGVDAFAFSRDGKWAAFSAGKASERQVWLATLEKEEAPVQLTRHSTPVDRWEWSPDSTQVFFLAPDRFDSIEEKRKERKFDVRIEDPVRAPDHLWSITLDGKTETRWTEGGAFGVERFTVSPDSHWVAFRSVSTDRHANSLDRVDSEIYTLELTSRAVHRITENHIAEGMPEFSPDSRWLVFTAPDGFAFLHNDKLYLAAPAGGPLRKLLPDWDHSANSPRWSADSSTIFFTEAIGVNSHLFAVSVKDGKLSQLTRERGVVGGPGFDRESGLFLISFTDPAEPGDYFVAKPETIGERANWIRVSRANPQVENFRLGRYETIHWKSTDGASIEGLLVYPLDYTAGKRYPLIVQIHGGPAGAVQNTFSGSYGYYAHIYAAAGYAVFQPNYRGSDAYGEKFRTQIAGDYFRQGFDDIMTGVDWLVGQGIADPDKMGMMGWSAGGHWSNWTLTHTDRFKAISSGAGGMNWISMYAQTDTQEPREFYFQGKPWENWDGFVAVSPLKYITNAKTPTLIHVGEADHRVPKPQSDELFMALKKLGVPVEYIVYPNMPHGLREPRYQMVKMVAEFNWFEKWIRGKPGWFDWKTLLATLPGDSSAGPRPESGQRP